MPKKSKEKNIIQIRFGDTIRELRYKLNLTQEALAERTRLDRSYIADIERGGRNVSLRNILKLAKGLEIEPEKLIQIFMNSVEKQGADWKNLLDKTQWTERG